MSQNVEFGTDCRKKIFAGMEKVAKAVGISLGPKGKLAAIENRTTGMPVITKDGVTIAKSINLKDRNENMGASLIKEIAGKSGDVGDGTTTATILGYAMAKEGLKAIETGISSSDIKKGMDDAVKQAVEKIKEKSVKVSSEKDIKNIATIASNNDAAIGSLLADAYRNLGKNGVINVADSSTTETHISFSKGMSFDNGYVSPYFITNAEKMECELKDALILITDETISDVNKIVPVLNAAAKENKPLLIVADDFGGEVIPVLIANTVKGIIKACAVKAPFVGDTKKEFLQDLACVTGAKFFSQSIGTDYKNASLSDLGEASLISISKSNTTISGGKGEKEEIDQRIAMIQKQLEPETNSYIKGRLSERLAKLTSGVCTLNVYADTDVELKELKDRIEDTLASVKASLKDGVVLGGGVTLLRTASELKAEYDDDRKIGFNIVKKALEEPIRQLADNAGLSQDIVVKDTLEKGDGKSGYNMLTMQWDNNLIDSVIDPSLVEISAIQNAASVVGLLLSTEVAITDYIPEKAN